MILFFAATQKINFVFRISVAWGVILSFLRDAQLGNVSANDIEIVNFHPEKTT